MGKAMRDQLDEVFPIAQVAASLGVGERTVYRLAASGKPLAFKLGATWRSRFGDANKGIVSCISPAALDDGEGA